MKELQTENHLDWQDITLPIVLALTGLVLLAAVGTGLVTLNQIRPLWPTTLILTGLTELAHCGAGHRKS